jgi:hypothetical protein
VARVGMVALSSNFLKSTFIGYSLVYGWGLLYGIGLRYP